jgi:hypothetical protein
LTFQILSFFKFSDSLLTLKSTVCTKLLEKPTFKTSNYLVLPRLASLLSLANLVNLASSKWPNNRKCWESSELPTFAKQFREYSTNLPNALRWYTPTCSHLPNPLFEKNYIHFAKFAWVWASRANVGWMAMLLLTQLMMLLYNSFLFYPFKNQYVPVVVELKLTFFTSVCSNWSLLLPPPTHPWQPHHHQKKLNF